MIVKKQIVLDESVFNFSAFKKDLLNILKTGNITLSEVSSGVLFRSGNYISSAFHTKRMPLNVAVALCERYGLNIRDYEVKKEEPKPAEKPVAVPLSLDNGWGCEIKIDRDFGVALMKITKDGNTVVTGRSYLYGTDDVGIMQSISYAAHMCYKLVQQNEMQNMTSYPDRVIFKDWIKKYEKANSPFGCFVRYVESHYKAFPSTGKKNMHVYLLQNNGNEHINAFKISFEQYLAWTKAQ